MVAAAPIPAKHYYDANAKIITIFEKLDEVINSIDRAHAKGKDVVNTAELFPMAEEFIRVASDATSRIHDAYIKHIQQGSSSAASQLIECEAWRILKEIKKVVRRANQLSVNPDSNRLRELKGDEYGE